jgi:hypothetical protein
MLGVLLATLVAPRPSPYPPLKTIIHLRSSPFCTTLRESIGPAVRALIENNIAFDQSKSLFLKLARDKVSSANRTMVIDMDVNRLGPLIDQVAQNLSASQAMLNNSRAFSAQPNSDDGRRLVLMQSQLRAIIAHQDEALNTLSGTYYSYNGNRLMGHGDGLKDPVDPPADTPIVLPPIKPAPYQSPSAVASRSPSVQAFSQASAQLASSPFPTGTPPSVDLGLMGLTKFTALFNNLTTYQVNEQQLEVQAAQTILQAAAECNSSQ